MYEEKTCCDYKVRQNKQKHRLFFFKKFFWSRKHISSFLDQPHRTTDATSNRAAYLAALQQYEISARLLKVWMLWVIFWLWAKKSQALFDCCSKCNLISSSAAGIKHCVCGVMRWKWCCPFYHTIWISKCQWIFKFFLVNLCDFFFFFKSSLFVVRSQFQSGRCA